MSCLSYLFYIKKRLLGKKWMLYLNICVSSLALALLCATVAIPQILTHSENMIKRSLADDLSKFGVVRNGGNAIFNEHISEYISDLYNAPEIDGIGTWTYGGFGYKATVGGEADYWNEILEIQNSHVREFDESPDEVQLVYMSGQAFHINHLELYRGSAQKAGTNTGYLMYLGYNFKDIPVGTVFVDEEYGISYVVEGILQKNTSIVDEQALLRNLGGLKLGCSIEMDNMLLVISPCSENYFSQDFFFKCSDGYTYEDAAKKIKAISKEYNIQTETGMLQDRIETVLSDVDWMLKGIDKISGLLFLTAFLMLLITQLLTVLFRKDEFGVWLISGIDRRKIIKILMGENMIKMLFSAFISFGIVMIFVKTAHVSVSAVYGLRYILWGSVPFFLLVCAILMSLLCSVIPIVYVQKKSIQDIVRGTWD